MNAAPDAPDPDLLYRLYSDHHTQALRLGRALDVFTPLEQGGASAPAVAEACRLRPGRHERVA